MTTPREKANKLISERIHEWHENISSLKLHEFLGFSEAEYAVWFESGEPPKRTIYLFEAVRDALKEGKVREADVSDGSKVDWGHAKHVKDLKKRIEGLTTWRDKHSRGSEIRANYSRLIQRLKSELKSAQAAAEKKKKKTQKPKR